MIALLEAMDGKCFISSTLKKVHTPSKLFSLVVNIQSSIVSSLRQFTDYCVMYRKISKLNDVAPYGQIL